MTRISESALSDSFEDTDMPPGTDTRAVVVGPRVEFSPAHYPRLRVWDGERDHYVYLHRLTAYAYGMIDSLWSDDEVHHIDHDGWNNCPENLQAQAAVDHRRYHAEENHRNGSW